MFIVPDTYTIFGQRHVFEDKTSSEVSVCLTGAFYMTLNARLIATYTLTFPQLCSGAMMKYEEIIILDN